MYVVLSTRYWLRVSTLCDDRCFLVDKSVGLSLLEPLCASVKLSVLFSTGCDICKNGPKVHGSQRASGGAELPLYMHPPRNASGGTVRM